MNEGRLVKVRVFSLPREAARRDETRQRSRAAAGAALQESPCQPAFAEIRAASLHPQQRLSLRRTRLVLSPTAARSHVPRTSDLTAASRLQSILTSAQGTHRRSGQHLSRSIRSRQREAPVDRPVAADGLAPPQQLASSTQFLGTLHPRRNPHVSPPSEISELHLAKRKHRSTRRCFFRGNAERRLCPRLADMPPYTQAHLQLF